MDYATPVFTKFEPTDASEYGYFADTYRQIRDFLTAPRSTETAVENPAVKAAAAPPAIEATAKDVAPGGLRIWLTQPIPAVVDRLFVPLSMGFSASGPRLGSRLGTRARVRQWRPNAPEPRPRSSSPAAVDEPVLHQRGIARHQALPFGGCHRGARRRPLAH